MKKLKGKILRFDIFGRKPFLRVKNNYTYNSYCGAFLTLLFIAFAVLFSLYKSDVITIDKNVGYQWSTQYMPSHTESSKAVFEEKNGLRIAFGIASHPNSKVNDVTEKYDT